MNKGIKFNIVFLLFYFLISGAVPNSFASLVETGDQNIVYDPVLNKYWFTNLPIFTSLNYSEQQGLMDIFNSTGIHGIENWTYRFATISELNSLYNTVTSSKIYMSHFMYTDQYPWFWGGYVNFYFRGYYNDEDQNPATVGYCNFTFRSFFDPGPGKENELFKEFDSKNGEAYRSIGAWVIAEPVPLPATLWLFFSGLVGIMVLRKRKKQAVSY